MKYKSLLIPFFSSLLWLLSQTTATAGVYKWIDENGLVHYSEKAGVTNAQQVTIRKNETTKPRVLKPAKDTEKQAADTGKTAKPGETEKNSDSQTSDNDKNKAAAEPKPVPAPVPKKEKNRLCKEAREDVTAIRNRGRMREVNSKGEYIYLSDKQRQQRLTAAKKKQREFCR